MTERFPPSLRFEFGALLLVTALATALRVVRLSGLAPDLGEAAHFLTANPMRFLEPRAWSAALGSAAPAIVWAILRRGSGPWIALAAAAITATTPWSVHASRSGTTLEATFVAALALFSAIRAARPAVALLVGAAAAALVVFAASKSVVTPQRIDPGAWLVADVGLGGLAFVLAAWFPASARPRVVATLGAGILCTVLLLQRYSTATGAASATACVVVLAAGGLGGWWEAAERPLPRLAALAMAVVPSMPSLASEFIDGGRFDLAPLALAFADLHQSGDVLFASDAELAEHGFGVDCRPLPKSAHAPSDFLPGDRPAWVLLLFDRGRPLGDPAGITPAIERQLALVARTFKKRLDLHRFEARLYRSDPVKRRPP
jgi:hypothetical protein